MTCIIATPRYMCADRRVTAEGESGSMVKVAKNRWLIAAASGWAGCSLAIVRAVRKGAQLPEDLIEHVDKDSYALVLTPDGRMQEISGGFLWACGAPINAIGSGADLAIGWLHGAGLADPSPKDLKSAQAFVAKRRVDCGGGCDVRFFLTGD